MRTKSKAKRKSSNGSARDFHYTELVGLAHEIETLEWEIRLADEESYVPVGDIVEMHEQLVQRLITLGKVCNDRALHHATLAGGNAGYPEAE